MNPQRKQAPKQNNLLDDVLRWIAHRERMMQCYGAWRTTNRLATVASCRNILQAFTNARTDTQARGILRLLPDLRTLAAGKTSKYYNSDQRKLARFEEMAEHEVQMATHGLGFEREQPSGTVKPFTAIRGAVLLQSAQKSPL